jgi:hypothetical protein
MVAPGVFSFPKYDIGEYGVGLFFFQQKASNHSFRTSVA